MYGQYGMCGYGAMVPYGSLNLTETSPPQSFDEPLSLTEAKTYVQIEQSSPADNTDDALLETLIPAAREIAEYFQNKDLVLKQQDMSLDQFFRTVIELRAPLVSVDLVQYRDSNGNYFSLTEDVDYVVDTKKKPGVILPAYNKSWPSFTPWPSSAVLVRFTSGLASTSPFWSRAGGAKIKQGMRYLIEGWYDQRLPMTFGSVEEIPFGISALLGYGALRSVK